MTRATYRGIYPIGDSDPQNMPVANVDRAAALYEQMYGHNVVARDDGPPRSVTLLRHDVRLRLAETGDDPEQASCYIEVSDIEGARAELEAAGADISPLRSDHHNGNTYQVFFLKDADGLCYCIGSKQT